MWVFLIILFIGITSDVEMVVLDYDFVYFAAQGAPLVFPVFETHFADMFATASDFNAYDAAVVEEVNTVIGGIPLGRAIHSGITHLPNF